MPMGVSACIKWSMLELTGLLEDEDARVFFQRSKRHLALHPFQLNDLNRALREILSSKVNFYDPDLQGLVLAYKNPKLLDSLGGILHDSYFIHVDIEADFYIFKPEIGCTLKGIANKKAGNHLGVLVHKAFNVSILKADDCEEWLGDYVFVGQEVKFTVTHLDFKGKLPFIRGELIADPTMGQIFYDRMNTEEVERKPEKLCVEEETSEPSVKRRKKSKKIESMLDNGSNGQAESNVNVTMNGMDETSDIEESSDHRDKIKKLHSSKKAKKKKIDRENDNVDSESSNDDRDGIKKHGKGKKKSIDERIDARNSALEVSMNDRDETQKPSRSTKKMIFDQIDGTRTSPDLVSSSDERGRIKSSVKIVQKSSDVRDSLNPNSTKSSEIGVKVKSQKVVSQDEETNWGLDEKPKVSGSIGSPKNKSKRIEEASKSENLKTSNQDERTVGSMGTEELNDEIKSPTKRSKRNRVSDSDEKNSVVADVKPEIRAKKKKKKDDESAEGIDVKPDLRTKKKKKDDESDEERKTEKQSRACDDEGKKIKLEHEEERKKRLKKSSGNEAPNDDELESKCKKQKGNATEDEEAKRKRKKKYSMEEEHVVENRPDVDEFEFTKPNLDAFEAPTAKFKRKRRKTVTENEEAPDSPADNVPDNSDFFRDVRIKVEPDLSDMEDFRLSKKRKKKLSTNDEEESDGKKRNDVEIKQEPNMSDVEDAKSVKKKSKRKTNGENSHRNVKVKTEPDASDIEESIKCKREPEESSKCHKSTTIKGV